jgi:hypothetical protein
MTANTPASRKAKGRRLQQQIRDDIIDGLELSPHDILSRAMGQAGSDLALSSAARDRFPFSVECKSQESLNIWKALEQCEANSDGELMPLLIFKLGHSQIYACLRWDDLLDIVTDMHLALGKRRR